MTDLSSVVGQLKKERDRAAKEVERLNAALAALDGYGKRTGRPQGIRRKLSAKALESIRKAQKKRWAAWRAKQAK